MNFKINITPEGLFDLLFGENGRLEWSYSATCQTFIQQFNDGLFVGIVTGSVEQRVQ